MATPDELLAALRKADAAGDAAGAKTLADAYRASTSRAPAQPLTMTGRIMSLNPMLAGARDVGEGALKFGTGLIGGLAGDVAGLGGIAADATGIAPNDPAALREKVSNALTYQPSQPSMTGKILEVPSRIIGGAGDYLKSGVQSISDNPAVQFAGDVAGAAPLGVASWLGLKTGGNVGRSATLARAPEGAAVRGAMEPTTTGATAISPKASGAPSPTVDLTAVNAERNAVFAEARKKGLVVPLTAINPSALNTAMESVAGKAMVRQQAQTINQPKINQLVAEDLGLPQNQPLSRPSIRQVIKDFGATKERVKKTEAFASDEQYLSDVVALDKQGAELESAYPGSKPKADPEIQRVMDSALVDTHTAAGAVNYATLLREQAKANFRAASMKGGDSQLTALARTQYGVATALEELVSRNLAKTGQKQLAQEWEQGRIRAAKAYVAEGALRGNDILASKLADQLRKNKPLSGNYDLIAKFADQFEEVSKRPKSGVGVSKLGAVLGGGGIVTGHPALAAIPVVGYAARRAMLGETAQNALVDSGVNSFSRYAKRQNALKATRRGVAVSAYPQGQR